MYTIRPFDYSDRDYELGVEIINTTWPDDRTTIPFWKHRDENRQKEYLLHRVFVEEKGIPVALGAAFESSWSHQPGKYGLDMDIPPAAEDKGLIPLFYEYALAFLAQRELAPTKLVAFAREDKAALVRFWQEQGFQQVMRYPVSQLDVRGYDFNRFNGAEEKVTANGIQIWRLTELMAADPGYRQKIYELEKQVARDIPSPDPLTEQPYDHFLKIFDRPNFNPDGWFMAVDPVDKGADPTGAYVGLSTIWTSPADPEKVYVGLTGVLPSHRRRGIARALKLRTFKFTQSLGAHIIETDNEENNPMYDLNLALGFQPKPAWLDFEKKFD